MENFSYLRSKYTFAGDLGQGANGTVVKAIRKQDDHLVAIKFFQYHGSDEDYTDATSETKALFILGNHPNVIKLHEVFKVDDFLFLVFDYMNTDLYSTITYRNNSFTPFPNSEIRTICFQLLKGLDYIHSYGFMHRDLKPENILISGYDEVKIADFGASAAIIPFTEYKDVVTTLWYRAPEVLLGDVNYGATVDMWAFGVIMSELYCGAPLFCGMGESDQLTEICKTMGTPTKFDCPLSCELAERIGYEFPQYEGRNLAGLMPNASKSAVDLIQSLLSWDANKRPTANQALNHPFFSHCFPHQSLASSWRAQGTTATMAPMRVC